MICLYERDDNLQVQGISLEIPIMTEHGWATMVVEQDAKQYATRGVMNTAVVQRTDVIENCPNATNEKHEEYPNYLSHRMWDGGFVKALD